ncbi:MAG: VacB/RNase II family 3'-5' exoribonuclease [Cyanobacteria bacterium]|nr:VacB/RNase II family 3'-5' exoribonuclease [Cyanobacteria bacterium CG_2015-16_32_12]NCO77847.1 VacB/RNase II family 3'-5' exoribonuclease [Cyanobacteria bacterium CG_2015-22_32_23]NCQ03388.1 VacB/RNase II family 3'-5' exoribonuclease [Cyanobacteria bacterium CG_2015-09_32_10]NCQ42184.1 VacB/RNase II family 3'-5' exoribonuclease [Cyanobacteria bacterium CG_2015-04_32_10]NCS84273.1 VacB/RNase II family 3'-5' exoribonuclease [Cyanobacteria bacterium CG_2015-02_32_10]
MEFSIATILSHLSADKLVPGKVLEKKLGCEEPEELEKLQISLDVLEKVGVVTKEFGKYRRVMEEDVVEAKLRCSSKGFCFAIQDEEDADDIYIRESHLSNAWNSDRVLVKIIKEGTRRRSPEGEVKLIVERANPSVLARVVEEKGEYNAVPLDDRLLFELNLKNNDDSLIDAVNHLVHVNVLRYPIGQNPPLGKVIRVLGSDAEAAADTDIVSSKHDLPQEFSERVLQKASVINAEITEAEIQQRLDLRDLLTITIEQEISKDLNLFIENAFTLDKTEDNHWRLGIHIVDVAHFVEPETHLDREARKRGTTVHLGEKIIPMLPEIVQNYCTLVPDVDRLTISVFLIFDEKGQVMESQIQPSIIRVDHSLTYKEVQNMIGTGSTKPELETTLELLSHLFFELAPLVKAQRLQRGGFDITLDQITSYFKDEGRIGAIASYASLPVLSLMTELMVLVGKVVAQHLKELQLPSIYCTQAKPDWDELEDLLKLVANLKLDFHLESEDELQSVDYYHLIQEFGKSDYEKVLHYLLLNSLKSDKYTQHPSSHFGLALPIYTHCVSPGQRYVDLQIQRILKALFQYGRDRRHSRVSKGIDLRSSTCYGEINWNVLPPAIQTYLEGDLHSLITHLNEREKIAQDAESDLAGLKKAEKMKDCTGKVFSGLITGVQSYGFFVQIEDSLVEGLVHVSSLKDDWYEYRSRHTCLVGRKNRTAYRLGDTVEVEVKSVDYYRQQIDLVTVRGGSDAVDEDFED